MMRTATISKPFTYPAWLTNGRQTVDGLLQAEINRALPPEIAKLAWRSVEKGRKVRSVLFAEVLGGSPHDPDLARRIITAIELSHAASIIVDDLIDQDDFRHDLPPTASELSSSVRILLTHTLTAHALASLQSHPTLAADLTSCYRRMTVAEMNDISVEVLRSGPARWKKLIADKTTPLFEFALHSGAVCAGGADRDLLRRIGNLLGLLYQIANDHYDWQPANFARRHAIGGEWTVTCGLPLALHLSIHGDKDISRFLVSTPLDRSEWNAFLSQLWTSEVREASHRELQGTLSELLLAIKELPHFNHLGPKIAELSVLVATEEFWYHSY